MEAYCLENATKTYLQTGERRKPPVCNKNIYIFFLFEPLKIQSKWNIKLFVLWQNCDLSKPFWYASKQVEKNHIFFVKVSAKTSFLVTGGWAQNFADMSATISICFYWRLPLYTCTLDLFTCPNDALKSSPLPQIPFEAYPCAPDLFYLQLLAEIHFLADNSLNANCEVNCVEEGLFEFDGCVCLVYSQINLSFSHHYT